jgi:ABC-type glutathione transport system ATPase component
MLEAVRLEKNYITGLSKKKTFSTGLVSFRIRRGEILGLMGPSGCGKTTVAKMIVGLLRPSVGRIILDGADASDMLLKTPRLYHRRVQAAPQHPDLSLDPKQTVGKAVEEVLLYHGKAASKKQARLLTNEWFERTGLSPEIARRFPSEISGGQAQRAALIRAMCLSPRYLVADEPTAMLDLSTQAEILRLIMDLKNRLKMGVLLISHDSDVVNDVCDRVLEMGSVEKNRNRKGIPFSSVWAQA